MKMEVGKRYRFTVRHAVWTAPGAPPNPSNGRHEFIATVTKIVPGSPPYSEQLFGLKPDGETPGLLYAGRSILAAEPVDDPAAFLPFT